MTTFHPKEQHDHPASAITVGLYRIGQAVALMLRRRAQGHGLTAAQAQALLFLAHTRLPARTVSGVAKRLGCSLATASQIVSTLVAKGLVRREPWSRHRRTVYLHLTAKGHALLPHIESSLDAIKALVEDFSDEEQERLLEMIRRLVYGLSQQGHIVLYEMCWECAYFRPHAHPDQPEAPHHCALIDAPLPDEETYVECPDFVPKEVSA